MALVALIAGILLIYQAVMAYKGSISITGKKILYVTFVIVVAYFAFYAFPKAKPIGVYPVTTKVEANGKTYTLIVDVSIELVEEFYEGREDVSVVNVKVYKPTTIHWPNGGYTVLDPDETEYAEKSKEYVWAYGYKEDQEYKILIPEISFSPTDKLLAMGWDAAFWGISMAMGLVAIILVNCKKTAK